MDQKTVAFARSWARRYVRTKHPHGLDEEDVENRILESLYYNKDKEKALSKALNAVQNEWTLGGEGFEGSAAGWEVAFGVVTLDVGEDPISLDVSTESATEVSASALPGSEVEAGTYPNATLKLTIERRDGDDPVSETLNIPIHLVVGE